MGKAIDVTNYDLFYQNIDSFSMDKYEAYDCKRVVTDEEYINKCREKHGDKYEYKIEKYVDENLIEVYCPKHNYAFTMKKHCHSSAKTCPKCSKKKTNYNESEYIAIVENMYGDLYDLSELGYTTLAKSVSPICAIHGKFTKRAYDFIKGTGCQKCNAELRNKKAKETKVITQRTKRAEETEQKKSKEIK